MGAKEGGNMKLYSIIIALSIMTVLTMSGCLSENEKLKSDILEPRENSEAGIKIIVTYLPDISDVTAFDIKVTYPLKAKAGMMQAVRYGFQRSKARNSNL